MYHRIEMIGNAGNNCELRYTADGKAVGSFSIAVNNKYGDKKFTIWYKITVWEKLAENCSMYVKKGMLVFCEGELVPDKETGNPRVFERKDGTSGASYEVRAREVRFLTKATDEETSEDEEMPFL